MDLFTSNAAISLNAQAARRADREREYRRVSHERTTEARMSAERSAQPETARPQREHRFPLLTMFRSRMRSAQ